MSRLAMVTPLASVWELEEMEGLEGDGSSPPLLHLLAKRGDRHQIQELLRDCTKQELADYIESRNSVGSTPLQVAAYFGQHEVVKLLQDYGANRYYRNKRGWNAVHYAARWSQPLDLRLAIGLKPRPARGNSAAFSYRQIRQLNKEEETSKPRLCSEDRMKSDSGISVFDSKEGLNLH